MIKNNKYHGTNKLVPHLHARKKYVIHYRNLKFLESIGVKIGTVHKVLSFEQSAWLKPYIDFNTQKRKEAKKRIREGLLSL